MVQSGQGRQADRSRAAARVPQFGESRRSFTTGGRPLRARGPRPDRAAARWSTKSTSTRRRSLRRSLEVGPEVAPSALPCRLSVRTSSPSISVPAPSRPPRYRSARGPLDAACAIQVGVATGRRGTRAERSCLRPRQPHPGESAALAGIRAGIALHRRCGGLRRDGSAGLGCRGRSQRFAARPAVASRSARSFHGGGTGHSGARRSRVPLGDLPARLPSDHDNRRGTHAVGHRVLSRPASLGARGVDQSALQLAAGSRGADHRAVSTRDGGRALCFDHGRRGNCSVRGVAAYRQAGSGSGAAAGPGCAV